ncbi:hypothetical protein TRFO_22108 [Tritrichomonas foetus]|uniref:Condensation domain-containing protein n=1 Tax=Tritrichomonas foetus TaxID=1144522 RepID=A0A1J4KCN4_9EUKA|nr:hypothetical protein TRFO_22108 [Tritrichomonas foetus]|eukprot:OHT09177.1 hypothetical protein TRFO_22108 [Tritrichomonas foetus]
MFRKVTKRVLSPFERKYGDTLIQLSVEVTKPSEIPSMIERLIKYAVPLHVSLDGDQLQYKEKVNVLQMPKDVSNIGDSCNWILKNMQPSKVASATLGYNDRFILVSSQHLCCDGGYFKYMINLIQDNLEGEKVPWNFLQIPGDEYLREHLKKMDQAIIYNRRSDTTVLKSRESDFERENDQLVRVSTLTFDAKKTHCYLNGRLNNLTDSLWSTFLLSIAAYNRELPNKFGIASCIDLRDRFPEKNREILSGITNFISILSHSCETNKDDTILSIGQKLRKSLNDRIKNGDLPAYYLYNQDSTKAEGSTSEISNMGPIFIKDPIKDVFMQISYKDPIQSAVLSLLTWSVVSIERNELAFRLRYQPSWLHDYEADAVVNGIKFALEELPSNTPVGDAFKEIQAFQDGYVRARQSNSK